MAAYLLDRLRGFGMILLVVFLSLECFYQFLFHLVDLFLVLKKLRILLLYCLSKDLVCNFVWCRNRPNFFVIFRRRFRGGFSEQPKRSPNVARQVNRIASYTHSSLNNSARPIRSSIISVPHSKQMP